MREKKVIVMRNRQTHGKRSLQSPTTSTFRLRRKIHMKRLSKRAWRSCNAIVVTRCQVSDQENEGEALCYRKSHIHHPKNPKGDEAAKHPGSMPRREMKMESSPSWRSESCATPNSRARRRSLVAGQYRSWCRVLDRKVSLSAPFLRLTVFETTDEMTNERILRCIDNRRLFALKEYAKKSGKDRVMVNVNLFSQNTLKQVQRFIHNSDDTDGRDVRLRKNRNNKQSRFSHRSQSDC